jgi:hypothetical protein
MSDNPAQTSDFQSAFQAFQQQRQPSNQNRLSDHFTGIGNSIPNIWKNVSRGAESTLPLLGISTPSAGTEVQEGASTEQQRGTGSASPAGWFSRMRSTVTGSSSANECGMSRFQVGFPFPISICRLASIVTLGSIIDRHPENTFCVESSYLKYI